MRVGIVGAGFMGTTHATAWAETEATIAGFVSKPAMDAQALAAQYNAKAYPDFEAILADVDVVDICTPTHLHHQMVLKAARAGKDIICEKPLARTVEQGQAMIAECETAGVKLLVGHVVRFVPDYARAKAIIDKGDIGRPAVIRLTRGTFRPKKAADNWFVDPDKSGGMMFDLMIHDFDYARWLAGEVETVFAKSISSNHPELPLDHGLAILKHRNGAISHIEGAWAYPPPLFRTRLEVSGSKGWLEADSGKTAAIGLHLHQQQTHTPDVPVSNRPLHESPYTTEIKAFYNALAHGMPVPISAVDGLAAVQIASAAIESAKTGVAITLKSLPEVTS